MDYKAEYKRWLENVADTDLQKELQHMVEKAMEDAFYS